MKNFITVEGCDGVGKTYQMRLLQKYCKDNNLDIVFTREPGGSAIAEQIRNIVLYSKENISDLCEAFLYASARVQHIEDIILPALRADKIVICDRFVHSSYTYQGLGRGLGLEKVKLLNDIAVGECMPEFTLFLDLPPEKAFDRKGGVDNTDRLENVEFEFHKRVYDGYRKLIEETPEKFVVIDASGTKEQTQEKIIEALKQKDILPN